MHCIEGFADLIEEAPALLKELQTRRAAYEKEMSELLPSLNDAIDAEVVRMDDSGKILEKPSNGVARKILDKIDKDNLISGDCRKLVEDLEYYLKLREQVKAQRDYKGLVEAVSVHQLSHPKLVEQMEIFGEYGYLHLTGELLQEALRDTKGVPGYYIPPAPRMMSRLARQRTTA